MRDCDPHLRLFPVVLGGRPETSACSSPGEPTTSKPWRPRMLCCPHCSPELVRAAPPAQVTAAVIADGVATDVPKRFVATMLTRSVEPTSVGATR